MIKTNVFQKKHFFFVFFRFVLYFFWYFSVFCRLNLQETCSSFWIPVQPLLNPSPGNNHARKAG